MPKIIITKPSESKLKELGIDQWSRWECEPSEFDWHYDDEEVAYVFEGKVKVTTADEEVEIVGGDMVRFSKGLSCHWQVIETIKKAYKFE